MPENYDEDGGIREPAPVTFEMIRERAYDLWERHHRPEGFEMEFWLLAERELRQELAKSRARHATSS